MIRNESALSYNKKALLAAGAAVGLGLITYRLWSGRRRQTTVDRVQRPKIDASPVSKVKEETKPFDDSKTKSVIVSESAAEASEAASLKPESSTSGADSLSVSGTYVKVSPAASPISFEEVGSSFVEPMSMPSTPPLIIEPTSLNTGASFSSGDSGDVPPDSINLSSLSFVAVSTEQDKEVHSSPEGEVGLSHGLEQTRLEERDNDVPVTEKNDLVVIGVTSSDQSSDNGSEDTDISEASKSDDPEQATGASADQLSQS